MERDSGRNQRLVAGIGVVWVPGQSTVEYAVVFAAFAAMVAALSVLWHAFGDGLLVEHALSSASHHLTLAGAAAAADVFLY